MLGALDSQPRVQGGNHTVLISKAFGYQLQFPTTSTYSQSVRSYHERLDDPCVSMLDLDDDPRLSVASDVYDDEQAHTDSSHDDSSHRLSYIGPNLRFHSRAPWETDDATFDDGYSSGFFSSPKKAFGFSNSPRTSDSYRPSGESTRSQAKSKQSFETTSSRISYPRGALYALAQESLSTSSLGASAAVVRSKRPSNHARPDSSNNTILPPSPYLSTHSNDIPLNNPSQRDTQLPSTSYHDVYPADDIHPYANPDLGFQVLEESPKQGIFRRDSDGTATIAHGTTLNSEAKSPVTFSSPFLSANTRNRTSDREISSPISVLASCEESQVAAERLSGWVDRVIGPGFSLISLEEARARKRSATSQSTVPLSTPSNSAPLPLMSHTESDSSDSRLHVIEGGFSPHSEHSQGARARSASAGTKARVAFQSMVGGEQPKLEADAGHGKALKHRKSGFMRLFNSGRGQDREEKIPPPPVPSLSNFHADLNTTQEVPKVATYQNFTPGPSPSIEASHLLERTPLPPDGPATPRSFLNTKRPIPSLSIETQPPHTPLVSHEVFQARTAPSTNVPRPSWLNNTSPQSAPANVSGFPALKLRPISTAFSAKFGEHIVLPDCGPLSETDVGTPVSPTEVFSPVTPGSAGLSDPAAFTSHISEDSVASALQQQVSNAKLVWQRQIWELERQIRDLKAEINDLHKADSEGTFCERCGRGQRHPKAEIIQDPRNSEAEDAKNLGIMNRPRARTGISSRFSNALS
ncbi:hypothetical protein C0992_007396 [Termitomyces sp. T32_za158]|nr:hypothetical protein C0992_007396 [Termitomyces sp. T32_za158]